MDFVDATILRLADESLRGAVFDGETLSQVLAASHDVADLGIEAPFAVTFDEVSFVHDHEPSVQVTGSWLTMGQTERTELALQAAGVGAPLPRIDLLIAGAVVASAGGSSGKVDAVELTWLELAGIDREIIPLPDDPAVREQRRRERLLARIQARLDQPAVFDDAALGRWLTQLGVGSVTELLRGPHAAEGATLKVRFGDTADHAAQRRRFPVAAALVVRDAPLSLATLLDDTRRLRPYLQRLGFGPVGDAGPRVRRAPIVAWVVPGALFDDEAWPGAGTGSAAEKRAQRRRWAGTWLARERIGLIVPPT